MANIKGMVNRVMSSRGGGGAAGRSGGLGNASGKKSSGQRGKDEAIGRGVRGVLSRFRR